MKKMLFFVLLAPLGMLFSANVGVANFDAKTEAVASEDVFYYKLNFTIDDSGLLSSINSFTLSYFSTSEQFYSSNQVSAHIVAAVAHPSPSGVEGALASAGFQASVADLERIREEGLIVNFYSGSTIVASVSFTAAQVQQEVENQVGVQATIASI